MLSPGISFLNKNMLVTFAILRGELCYLTPMIDGKDVDIYITATYRGGTLLQAFCFATSLSLSYNNN